MRSRSFTFFLIKNKKKQMTHLFSEKLCWPQQRQYESAFCLNPCFMLEKLPQQSISGCIYNYYLYPELNFILFFYLYLLFKVFWLKHSLDLRVQAPNGHHHSHSCVKLENVMAHCNFGAVAVQPANSKISTELQISKSFQPFPCADSCSPLRFPIASMWPGFRRHPGIFCLITPL